MTTRNKVIRFRLSEEEADQLEKDVKRTGMSRENYLRVMAAMKRPRVRPPLDFAPVLRNLSDINLSLERLATEARRNGAPDKEEYQRNVDTLQETMSTLIREVTA